MLVSMVSVDEAFNDALALDSLQRRSAIDAGPKPHRSANLTFPRRKADCRCWANDSKQEVAYRRVWQSLRQGNSYRDNSMKSLHQGLHLN